MKSQRIFVYAKYQNDAVQLVRAYGMVWTDHQASDGMAWWLNPRSSHWFAGLETPFVLHWHCESIPDEHRELMKSRYAFVVPVHCSREGCHDQSKGPASRV